MKAICIIAHPDDCIIYARPLIEATPSINWTIMYVTNKRNSSRGKEISKYWKDKNLIFLEHDDEFLDNIIGRTKIPATIVRDQIQELIHEYEMLLTHGPDGEYGHIHHKLISKITESFDIFRIEFSNNPNFIIKDKPLDLDLLPLHKEAIEKYYDCFGKYYIKADSFHQQYEALINAITRRNDNIHLP